MNDSVLEKYLLDIRVEIVNLSSRVAEMEQVCRDSMIMLLDLKNK